MTHFDNFVLSSVQLAWRYLYDAEFGFINNSFSYVKLDTGFSLHNVLLWLSTTGRLLHKIIYWLETVLCFHNRWAQTNRLQNLSWKNKQKFCSFLSVLFWYITCVKYSLFQLIKFEKMKENQLNQNEMIHNKLLNEVLNDKGRMDLDYDTSSEVEVFSI